eukprot:511218_1
MSNLVDWSLDHPILRRRLLILSKNDIKKICKSRNVSYFPNMSKAEIINQILQSTPKKNIVSTNKKKKKSKGKNKTSNNNSVHTNPNTGRKYVVVKVGFLGEQQSGSKSLLVRYVENKFDEDYVEILATNFMEKTIHLKNIDVLISCWINHGERKYNNLIMMPLICTDALCIIFLFDLTNKNTLLAVKRWYKEARKENKIFMPFLVGNKYDLFEEMDKKYKLDITKQARKFASKMHSPLIYCSCSNGINVKKIFKIIVGKVFDLNHKIKEQFDELKEPLIEFIQLSKQQKDCLVSGYVRSVQQEHKWQNKMPVADFASMILVFL